MKHLKFFLIPLFLLLAATTLIACSTPSPGGESSTEPFPEEETIESFVVRREDMTVNGSAKRLSDGTILLSQEGRKHSVTFTVTAPVSGIYRFDMPTETCEGYLHYLYTMNDTVEEEWSGGHAESRMGTEKSVSVAESDDEYMVGNLSPDGQAEAYIYLRAGKNDICMYIGGSLLNTKLGMGDITVSHVLTFTEGTQLLFGESKSEGYENIYTAMSSTMNNGMFLREGSTVYFDLNAPEKGHYTLYGLLSTSATKVTLSSMTESFIAGDSVYSSVTLGGLSTSVVLLPIAELDLDAGTHTVRLDVPQGWFHYNLLILKQTGYYDASNALLLEQDDFDFDKTTGGFSVDLSLTGKSPYADTKGLTLRVDISGTANGKAFTESLSETRGSGFVTSSHFSFDGVDGVESIRIVCGVYDGDRLVTALPEFKFSVGSGLRVLIMTDTHYTGSNMYQKYYDYGNNRWIENTLKNANNYTAEYDIYGWTSDEKLQRIMDDTIMRYENGEIDMVFILGDAAMNDGNYGKFETNNVRYTGTVYSDPSGETCNGFETHPLNVSYMVKEYFFDQLSEHGIPYYVANGNHDYLYTYNDDKTDLDYTMWENLYHYAELFGHRTDEENGKYVRDSDGHYVCYEDSDSADFLVRVIRRDGAVKILSAMSESELLAFKERYEGDGNCYDFYVSEDTLTESDELLCAFVMVNGFQIDTYDYYTQVGVVNGNFTGQTIRYSFLKDHFVEAMFAQTVDYENVYIVGHLVGAAHVKTMIEKYPGVKAIFSGDVHNENVSQVMGIVSNYVVGHNASAYDIDSYYNADGTPDNQYYYSRGTSTIGNQIWGDFTRHPFNFMTLDVYADDLSYAERVHLAAFYENGYQTRLTYDEVRGMDVRYKRAIADASYDTGRVYYVTKGDTALYTESELITSGADMGKYRAVYLGGDVAEVGQEYAYLTDSYRENELNHPLYRMDRSGNLYTLAGEALGATATVARFTEGTTVRIDGYGTYTIMGLVGEVSGHYLYDEKGDYVYVDENGDYVFYQAIEKADDYIEASIQSYSAEIPYERIWFYLNEDDQFVMLDEDEDGILDDGVYDDIRLVTFDDIAANSNRKSSKYYVDPDVNTASSVRAKIVVEDGRIVSGEGFCNFSYVCEYTYADGSFADEWDILHDLDENGDTVYGMYIPYMVYEGVWYN